MRQTEDNLLPQENIISYLLTPNPRFLQLVTFPYTSPETFSTAESFLDPIA